MNKKYGLLILCFISLKALSSNASERRLSGYEIKHCSADRKSCLHAISPEAIESQAGRIQRMKSPRVIYKTEQKTREFLALNGYIDFENEKIVFITKENKELKEVFFDFETLQQQMSTIEE